MYFFPGKLRCSQGSRWLQFERKVAMVPLGFPFETNQGVLAPKKDIPSSLVGFFPCRLPKLKDDTFMDPVPIPASDAIYER